MNELFGQSDFWSALSVANWRELGAALCCVAAWRCASGIVRRNAEGADRLGTFLTVLSLGCVFNALRRPFDFVSALYCVAAFGFVVEITRIRKARRDAERAKRRAEAERRRKFWSGEKSRRGRSSRSESSGRSRRSRSERSGENRGSEAAENQRFRGGE